MHARLRRGERQPTKVSILSDTPSWPRTSTSSAPRRRSSTISTCSATRRWRTRSPRRSAAATGRSPASRPPAPASPRKSARPHGSGSFRPRPQTNRGSFRPRPRTNRGGARSTSVASADGRLSVHVRTRHGSIVRDRRGDGAAPRLRPASRRCSSPVAAIASREHRRPLRRLSRCSRPIWRPSTGRAACVDRITSAEQPIDLVVNNAGFGTSGVFHELDVERLEDEIEFNVSALTTLSARRALGDGAPRTGLPAQRVERGQLPGRARARRVRGHEGVRDEPHRGAARGGPQAAACTSRPCVPGSPRPSSSSAATPRATSTSYPDFVWTVGRVGRRDGARRRRANNGALAVPGALYKGMVSAAQITPRSSPAACRAWPAAPERFS